jgi:hypothetical protein
VGSYIALKVSPHQLFAWHAWLGAHEALPEVIYSECVKACMKIQVSTDISEASFSCACKALEEQLRLHIRAACI